MTYEELLKFLKNHYEENSANKTMRELFWKLRHANSVEGLQLECFSSENHVLRVESNLGEIYYGTGNRLVRKMKYIGYKDYPIEKEGDVLIVIPNWMQVVGYLFSSETRRIPPL